MDIPQLSATFPAATGQVGCSSKLSVLGALHKHVLRAARLPLAKFLRSYGWKTTIQSCTHIPVWSSSFTRWLKRQLFSSAWTMWGRKKREGRYCPGPCESRCCSLLVINMFGNKRVKLLFIPSSWAGHSAHWAVKRLIFGCVQKRTFL